MSDPVARRRVGAVVRGIVQGVGFRRFVERTGSGLGLDGWVMNRADGSVELDAEGPPDAIDALIAALHEGPPAAWVEGVMVCPRTNHSLMKNRLSENQ